MTNSRQQFEIKFGAEGTCVARFRNEISVRSKGAHVREFELPTDEGPNHGGDESAPTPLAYFTAALTGCLMTQLRAFSRHLGLPVTEISVVTECHWQAYQQPDKTYDSSPVAFSMDVDVKGELSAVEKRALLRAAQKGCFVEQSLRPGLVQHRLKVDGQWLES